MLILGLILIVIGVITHEWTFAVTGILLMLDYRIDSVANQLRKEFKK